MRQTAEGTVLTVFVVPRSSRAKIEVDTGEADLRIKVTAPPVEGAANQAVVALLADFLRLPQRYIKVVAGCKSRHKSVLIQGARRETISSLINRVI